MDQYELEMQGLADHVNGTESYSSRYYQGVLFANGIIGLNAINGSEGLLAAIWSKIKQFCAWVASLFTNNKKKEDTIKKKIDDNIDKLLNETFNNIKPEKEVLNTSKVKSFLGQFKSDGDKHINQLETHLKRLVSLLHDKDGLEKAHGDIFKDLHHADPDKIKELIDKLKSLIESTHSKLEDITKAKTFSTVLEKFAGDSVDLIDRVNKDFPRFTTMGNEETQAYLEKLVNKVPDEAEQNKLFLISSGMISLTTKVVTSNVDYIYSINSYLWKMVNGNLL